MKPRDEGYLKIKISSSCSIKENATVKYIATTIVLTIGKTLAIGYTTIGKTTQVKMKGKHDAKIAIASSFF